MRAEKKKIKMDGGVPVCSSVTELLNTFVIVTAWEHS